CTLLHSSTQFSSFFLLVSFIFVSHFIPLFFCFLFFFFNDTAPTEIYTLSLHDALPIYEKPSLPGPGGPLPVRAEGIDARLDTFGDRKSTRLNSSHVEISYAVFCLKKKKKKIIKKINKKKERRS